MDRTQAERIVASRPWWYHKFEIYPGVVTPGVYDPGGTLKQLQLPEDLGGVRILEIGPADGYFTKTLTARGAHVTAVDYAPKDQYGFAAMEAASGRTFNFIHCNLFDLPNLELQPFEIVICLGVLYHLPDMCRGIHVLRGLTAKRMILETRICVRHLDEPIAEYFVSDSNNNDDTNFWAPNPLCCNQMLEDAGFVVESQWINDNRGMFRCVTKPPTRKLSMAYEFLRKHHGEA